jgi:hypothetical protein
VLLHVEIYGRADDGRHLAVDARLGFELIGRRLDARVDAHTVKLYWRGELIKVHPVVAPGRRRTDPADLPAEVSVYAMRDLNTLQRKAAAHGTHVGAHAAAVVEHPLPTNSSSKASPTGNARSPPSTSRSIRTSRIDRKARHRPPSPHGQQPETPGPVLTAKRWSHHPGKRQRKGGRPRFAGRLRCRQARNQLLHNGSDASERGNSTINDTSRPRQKAWKTDVFAPACSRPRFGICLLVIGEEARSNRLFRAQLSWTNGRSLPLAS